MKLLIIVPIFTGIIELTTVGSKGIGWLLIGIGVFFFFMTARYWSKYFEVHQQSTFIAAIGLYLYL